MLKFAMVFAFSLASMASSSAPAAPDYRIAADQLDNVIRERYAYLDKLPGGAIPSSRELDEARRVGCTAFHRAHDVERGTDCAVIVRCPSDQREHLARCIAFEAGMAVDDPRCHRLSELEPVLAGSLMPVDFDMGEHRLVGRGQRE